jgi:hypothetical protein
MNPVRPAFKTSCKFIPKPSATTHTWRSILAEVRVAAGYGCVKVKPKIIPRLRATGGEMHPVKERTKARKKMIFERAGIARRKSMRVEASTSNGEIVGDCEIHPHFYRVKCGGVHG